MARFALLLFLISLFPIKTGASGPDVPKSVIDLQVYRESTTLRINRGPFAGATATLTNINPAVNAWYLLSIIPTGNNETLFYHFENPKPLLRRISLNATCPGGLLLTENGNARCYPLWESATDTFLQAASIKHGSYVPICDGALYLRNRIQGHKTSLEWTTDFLRTRIPGGEKIVEFAKSAFFRDRFFSTAALKVAAASEVASDNFLQNGPAGACIDSEYLHDRLDTADLGIETDADEQNGLTAGRWYPVKNAKGMFVSIIRPDLVSGEIEKKQKRLLNPLDSTEAFALAYMIAFDLDRYGLNFVMGTDHPGVEWSDRVNPAQRVETLDGPDGIGKVWPLAMTGMVPPFELKQTVAAFAAGFRRYHGAFKYGPLSVVNHGSHYGFIENGAVMSKLQPGLATVIMYIDGTVAMKSWRKSDNANLPFIKHARQNGVALVEYDSTHNISTAGPFVGNRSYGNWSGSQSDKLRTLRAGIALQQSGGKRFLLYGFFSTATPSAMAAVFLAYQCTYAMLTDMNALEHTYLAIYQPDSSNLRIQHLVRGMEVLDIVNKKSEVLPRFIGYPDNRDFFYLVKKGGS